MGLEKIVLREICITKIPHLHVKWQKTVIASVIVYACVQFISGPSKCQLNKLWLGHTLSQEPYLKRRGKWCRSLTTVVNTIMAVCEVGSSPRSWYIVYFVAFERRCSIVVRCKAGCNCIPHCGVLNQNQLNNCWAPFIAY